MNEQAAYALIDKCLKELRQRAYPDLVALIGHPQAKSAVGEDQKEYQLEIQVVWDSRTGGDIRVMVAADDGGWRSFKPLAVDFVMASDGSIVGESSGGV